MAKKPPERKKKDHSRRNGTLAGLITIFAYANIFGLTGFTSFVVCGLLALLIGSVVRVATAPMKGIEAPKSSNAIRTDDVEDEYAKNMIATGLEHLEQLGRERNAINETIFTRRINEFIAVFRDTLNIVVKDYSKASSLRKMNTYYIPTIIKLLQSYREAKSQGTSYTEISPAREKLLKTLDELVQAGRNIKKSMIRTKLDRLNDTREVLEDMLRADGYIEDEETTELRESAEAAVRDIDLPEMPADIAPAKKPVLRKREAPAKPAAPVKMPAERTPAARQQPTVAQPVAMPFALNEETDKPVPQLQVNAPTASAQQMHQGAPVLHVPGLIPENETPAEAEDETLML